MKMPFFLLLMTAVLAPARIAAQATPEVEITSEPHHQLVFSNDHVRVFHVDVPPHRDTLLHWHRHDYFYVMLAPAEVVNAVKGKDPAPAKLEQGQVGFTPGGFTHIARNPSELPFLNVTIEILQDDNLRHSPAHWDEDRGLNILDAGTQQVLMVKDGIRASEFELQTNGAIPSNAKPHPLLLIAVNDLDLYLNDPRRHDTHEPAVPVTHFRAGESRWIPTGFRHPFVNAGQGQAKFVTLEFP